MTLNSAFVGGAVNAADDSTVTTTNCTLASNSAHTSGGAVAAGDASTVAATECAMSTNSALWGGAISAGEYSIVTASNCTMKTNSAYWGGAVRTNDDSTITVTDCTMTSNSAVGGGGAVAIADGSTVILSSCLIFSNRAYEVRRRARDNQTAPDCLNSPVLHQGGGLFLASNAPNYASLVGCRLHQNSALVSAKLPFYPCRSDVDRATCLSSN
jgi:hypothetical protein